MLLEALCGRAAAAGPRGDRRPAAGRNHAAGGADGVDPRRPPPHADLPLARLGDLLWSDRPESFRNARGRPAARAANAARLGRARSPLGRRRWRRPGPHRTGHGPDRLPPLPDKSGTGPRWWNCPRPGTAYWQGREAKFRKNIDRLQRRMAEQGKMELVRYRPEPACGGEVDPRWDLYDACVALAQRSWQGENGDKTNLCHAQVGGFFRDAHAAAARLGAVDLNLLYFNDQPAAFMYNYRWQTPVYGLRRGFDPQFKHLAARPGLAENDARRRASSRRPLLRPGHGQSRYQAGVANERPDQLPLHLLSGAGLAGATAVVESLAPPPAARRARHCLLFVG